MNRPLRENLEVVISAEEQWLRCTHCARRLCSSERDWKAAALRRLFPPTHAGPLMKVLEGRYLLQKLYCPSCGVLLDAQMVETKLEA